MQETWVRSLGPEDPLEEEIATHSSILAWRSPWTEEPGGHKESDTTEQLTISLAISGSSHPTGYKLLSIIRTQSSPFQGRES